jgi:hypothetical protein
MDEDAYRSAPLCTKSVWRFLQMYCVNCGQETVDTVARCSRCGFFSRTSWLIIFTVAVWLAILAMNYAVFVNLFPALMTLYASADAEIPRVIFWQISWANRAELYGLLVLPILWISVFGLASRSGRFPNLGGAIAVFTCLGLVFMVIVTVADCRHLLSIAPSVNDFIERITNQDAELRALDSTRRVIIAEFRYQALHPKTGFTCDLGSLVSLGGPVISNHADREANQPDTISDVYKLSLRSCQGQPVTRYEVSAAFDPSFGQRKVVAYCSDESGVVYSSADGKSETCLTARTPLH